MNRNFLIGAVTVVILLAGGYMLVKNTTVSPVKEIETQQSADDDNLKEDNPQAGETTEVTEKDNETEEADTFKLEASNFKYDVTEIKVKQGTKVKVKLTIKQGFHDFVIDEFNAKTKQLSEGQSETVELVADKRGTFEYYCSVGQHRQNGMVGKLIVE